MTKINTQSNSFFSSTNYSVLNEENAPIIVAYELQTPENFGSIIRTAANIGCRKVLFIKQHQEIRISKIKKAAASAFNCIDWKIIELNELSEHIPNDYSFTALETASNSTNIYTTSLPAKMTLIVGNEIKGIPEELLLKCKNIVHIPMPGIIKSMNVAHATTAAIFEWYRQKYFL